MTKPAPPQEFLERGHVDKRQWQRLYQASDPGDIGKPVDVKFIPHRTFLNDLAEVMSVAEHEAIVAAKDVKIERLTESRLTWKSEYLKKMEAAKALEAENAELREELNEIKWIMKGLQK